MMKKPDPDRIGLFFVRNLATKRIFSPFVIAIIRRTDLSFWALSTARIKIPVYDDEKS